MSEEQWVVLVETPGKLQAEIIRGILEAQEIPVVLLSQEGVGDAYGLTVGTLGLVPVMVPSDHLEHAQQLLEIYTNGVFGDVHADTAPPEETGEDDSGSLPVE